MTPPFEIFLVQTYCFIINQCENMVVILSSVEYSVFSPGVYVSVVGCVTDRVVGHCTRAPQAHKGAEGAHT